MRRDVQGQRAHAAEEIQDRLCRGRPEPPRRGRIDARRGLGVRLQEGIRSRPERHLSEALHQGRWTEQPPNVAGQQGVARRVVDAEKDRFEPFALLGAETLHQLAETARIRVHRDERQVDRTSVRRGARESVAKRAGAIAFVEDRDPESLDLATQRDQHRTQQGVMNRTLLRGDDAVRPRAVHAESHRIASHRERGASGRPAWHDCDSRADGSHRMPLPGAARPRVRAPRRAHRSASAAFAAAARRTARRSRDIPHKEARGGSSCDERAWTSPGTASGSRCSRLLAWQPWRGGAAYEVVIVGAGIAGASLAYFLAERGLRRRPAPRARGAARVHSTGRSAATLVELDSNPTLLELKIQSAPFFRDPPAGLRRRTRCSSRAACSGSSRRAHWERDPASARPRSRRTVSPRAALARRGRRARSGARSTGGSPAALWVPERRPARRARDSCRAICATRARGGAELRLGAEVAGRRRRRRSRAAASARPTGELRARLVVDAAGAWAGRLARARRRVADPARPAPPDHRHVRAAARR